ncbi:MAG: glycosyltransferase [Phycisphaerae bacterium]|nr:glycosyltransferase [Phycisphaerae bacterium]
MLKPLNCTAVLTHHWLIRRRGGERVLEALGELLPGSPIYTLVHNPDFRFEPDDPSREIYTSFLQYLPHAVKLYPKLLPLMPWAARRMRLPEVDLVVCSDASIAKAMTPHDSSRVVCYCHSPVRYAWDPEIAAEYGRSVPLPLRPVWNWTLPRIRRTDFDAAQRVDVFVANSRHVATRIRHYYEREATVVYPPVDLPPEPVTGLREDFLLAVGHHVPYKRLDLSIDACRELKRRLVVIGEGPDVKRLKKRKHASVTWLGWQAADVINDHYSRAAALLFPGEEDFGIVPVEAMAHGCPVIAYGVGGACETVIPGQTGALFEHQTVEDICNAIRVIDQVAFDPTTMHVHTQKFSRQRFLTEMHAILRQTLSR